MSKQTVFLPGASGSMGFEAFKRLWAMRDKYDIVLLQRPSKKNKRLFKPFEKKCGIKSIKGNGIVTNNGLKIVWGDAVNNDDIIEACSGIDWCLCPMAIISPEADLNPEYTNKINIKAIKSIINAIETQPGGKNHIKFIYIGSIVQTGSRLPPIHHGRVGDPMKPAILDYYAVSKVKAELALCESNLRYWASLRQTFILIPNLMSLLDPIMFHQPINTFMECITVEDAGRGLINCLNIPENSDFWRKCYNMGGGPSYRINYYDLLNNFLEMNGIGKIDEVTERNWFALRNFHMYYLDDSNILERYIHNWSDSLDDYIKRLKKNRPLYLKIVSVLSNKFPWIKRKIQKITYRKLKKLVMDKTGTLYWYKNKLDNRISAFYGSYEDFESIPPWGVDMPLFDPEPDHIKLDHGYDESKPNLDLEDLQATAKFRGGECLSSEWDGSLYSTIEWKCAFGHPFNLKPYTVLKAGHWCPQCLPPPWNYDEQAKKNKFFAQVWYPNHDNDENNFYPEDSYLDIFKMLD